MNGIAIYPPSPYFYLNLILQFLASVLFLIFLTGIVIAFLRKKSKRKWLIIFVIAGVCFGTSILVQDFFPMRNIPKPVILKPGDHCIIPGYGMDELNEFCPDRYECIGPSPKPSGIIIMPEGTCQKIQIEDAK